MGSKLHREAELDAGKLNAFWRKAFLNAELSILARRTVQKTSPQALAHLAAEYADSALSELQRRVKL